MTQNVTFTALGTYRDGCIVRYVDGFAVGCVDLMAALEDESMALLLAVSIRWLSRWLCQSDGCLIGCDDSFADSYVDGCVDGSLIGCSVGCILG